MTVFTTFQFTYILLQSWKNARHCRLTKRVTLKILFKRDVNTQNDFFLVTMAAFLFC